MAQVMSWERGYEMLRRLSILVVVALAALGLAGCAEQPGAPAALMGSGCTVPPLLLPGASLFNCDLSGIDLVGVNLSGADLRGANLSGADMRDANLSGANLTGANLTGANLTGADLAGAILSGAILLGAIFVGADLLGAELDFGAIFQPPSGATSSGGSGTPVVDPGSPQTCDEYCAGYNEATVDTGRGICDENYGANLGAPEFYMHRDEATLAAAGMRSVVTDASTDFRGATLGGELFSLRGLSLANADFSQATITGGDGLLYIGCRSMAGAKLDQTSFTGVDFYDVDMSNSSLNGASFNRTRGCGVNFSGASMVGALISDFATTCADLTPDVAPSHEAVVTFEGANLSQAVFGDRWNPQARNQWYGSGGVPGVSFRNANLSQVTAFAPVFDEAIFTGATTWAYTSWSVNEGGDPGLPPDPKDPGAGVDQRDSYYLGVDFSDAADGWSNAAFVGPHHMDGAICPDGSPVAAGSSCF